MFCVLKQEKYIFSSAAGLFSSELKSFLLFSVVEAILTSLRTFYQNYYLKVLYNSFVISSFVV